MHPRYARSVRRAALASAIVALAHPVAVAATVRHVRPTTQVSYHPQVVGAGLSAELEAYDVRRTGLFGERSWILTIGELNAAKGTRYGSFEQWIEAEPGDRLAQRLGPLLADGTLGAGGRFGERGR